MQTLITTTSKVRNHAESIQVDTGVSPRSMGSSVRVKRVKDARHKLWFQLVIVEGWSLPKAAYRVWATYQRHYFDHTTVLSGVRRHAHEALGTPLDAGLTEIRKAYTESQPDDDLCYLDYEAAQRLSAAEQQEIAA